MHNLKGMKFGKWNVIERNGKTNDNHIKWLCQCDCGNKSNVSSNDLISGKSKQCIKCAYESKKTHGLYKSKLYKIYHSMINRCNNKNEKEFNNYGGRGIKVCDEWQNNFLNFYNWAMTNGYADNLSIDRIDNNGNYCPENCRWATRKEQNCNTRRNRLYTHNGKNLTLTDWCRELKINYERTRSRLRLGWNFEDAIKEVN